MGKDGYYVKIAVDFYARDDGGLRATCPDLPELVLSSPDADAVLEDVAPAIEHIMKLNHGVDIEMRPLTAAKDFLMNRGVMKPTPRADHTQLEFAGRLRAA